METHDALQVCEPHIKLTRADLCRSTDIYITQIKLFSLEYFDVTFSSEFMHFRFLLFERDLKISSVVMTCG